MNYRESGRNMIAVYCCRYRWHHT